ncbi:hypothetical protein SAMN04489761_3606 [Tenacibaculum sp. MAR_2009_124]|nr:hypothetical protein SAMN04489761_3606 [Tenacibaculum sp. MAR_2009_124]
MSVINEHLPKLNSNLSLSFFKIMNTENNNSLTLVNQLENRDESLQEIFDDYF